MLTVCNFALDFIISDKTSISIINYLLEQLGTTISHKEIASKLLKHLKSIEDYQMTDASKYRMHLFRAHMNYIQS